LDELIDRALRTNNDLAAATIKVHRAQLNARLTATNLTPDASIKASHDLSRDLKNGTDSRSSSATGSLSYELDLWGKLARARDADRWEAEATAADRQNTALSLIGTTASAYWQVCYLNQNISSSEASIEYAQKTLAIVRTKYQAGAVSELELLDAEQTLATQKASLTKLLQQRVEARNTLAILFDQAPQNSIRENQQLPWNALPPLNPACGQPVGTTAGPAGRGTAAARKPGQRGRGQGRFLPLFYPHGSLGGASTNLTDVLKNPSPPGRRPGAALYPMEHREPDRQGFANPIRRSGGQFPPNALPGPGRCGKRPVRYCPISKRRGATG
jgi:hypothetical protein